MANQQFQQNQQTENPYEALDEIGKSELFMSQLELEEQVSLDRLRRERSRNHITFKTGGGVMTLSLDARNGRRNIEAAMGFGGGLF